MSVFPRSTTNDIDLGECPFVVISSAEANPTNPWMERPNPVTSPEALACPRAAYGGAIRLMQGRVLGPYPSPDTELLLELIFWSSRRDAEAFATELSRTRSTWVVDEGIYRLTASVTASPDDATHTDLVRTRSTPATRSSNWRPSGASRRGSPNTTRARRATTSRTSTASSRRASSATSGARGSSSTRSGAHPMTRQRRSGTSASPST